jgi:hypothetical protein
LILSPERAPDIIRQAADNIKNQIRNTTRAVRSAAEQAVSFLEGAANAAREEGLHGGLMNPSRAAAQGGFGGRASGPAGGGFRGRASGTIPR